MHGDVTNVFFCGHITRIKKLISILNLNLDIFIFRQNKNKHFCLRDWHFTLSLHWPVYIEEWKLLTQLLICVRNPFWLVPVQQHMIIYIYIYINYNNIRNLHMEIYDTFYRLQWSWLGNSHDASLSMQGSKFSLR